MKKFFKIAAIIITLIPCSPVLAGEPQEDGEQNAGDEYAMEEVVVSGEKIVIPTKQTDDTVYTGAEVTKEGIKARGQGACVSVYNAVDILPGVVAESTDPYGLAAEQSQIRTRGVRGYLGSMTVEGVPNYGGNPMGPRDYIYDMENMDGIAVYKGAVPGDLGIGVGARGGAIELRPRWPEEEFGVDLSQSFAENKYTRSFVRMDSGELPGVNTALAGSYSFSQTDKWKGPGEIGPRNNASFMLSQPLGDQDVIKLWYNYNYLKQDLYRPLTYDEVEDLHGNYNLDYNDELTGTKADDLYYYEYNRGKYANQDVMAVVPISFSDSFRLTFKPYYSEEDSEISQGVASMGGSVQVRTREIERYGVISQLDWKLQSMTIGLGYFFESSDMEIANQFYDPVTLAFKGYGMYMENESPGLVNSPYIKLAGGHDKLDWQAGLKYFHYRDPESQGYISPPPDYVLVKADDLVREEKVYEAYLPTLGVSYHLSDSAEVYASYGRNHIRPYAYMPLINLYNQNRTTFQNAGITLDELFDNYDMEISDSYEVGARFHDERMDLSGSLFYATHDNLITPVYDPRVDLTYNQFVGEAAGYGVELVTNFYPIDNLTIFVNPAYTSLTYDEDISYQGQTLEVKGSQVVDTPEWTVKGGAIVSHDGFEFVSRLRYIGDRYADVEHEEKIDGYFVTDLKLGYTAKNYTTLDALTLSVEVNNVFNEEYVSNINSSDTTMAGASSFQVGAPRTVLFNVSAEF